MSHLSLAEYGLIGNEASMALVSRLGAIDWCCFPHPDSSSHFAAMLDESQGGRFQIAPSGEFRSEQRYRPRTNVLETIFETPSGRAVLTDWMPMEDQASQVPMIVRQVRMVEGRIAWSLTCSPRFSFGAERASAEEYKSGILFRGIHVGDLAQLHCVPAGEIPFKIEADGSRVGATFTLETGDTAQFVWAWGRRRIPDIAISLQQTIDYWEKWAHRCTPGERCPFAGPWHDAAVRSGLTLRMLYHSSTGAISEAATTSLPSITGGSRNWDYRYCWLRDSALAVQALAMLGHADEANAFFQWLSDIVTRDGAESLQPVYTLDGGRLLPERELTFLGGYQGSRPVRIGNQSARQFQLDIYGHVMMAAAQEYELTGALPQGLWPKLAEIAEYVCQAWRRPDQGPWEARTKPQHFVASKVMCWAALDRACKLAESMGLHRPSRWANERAILHKTICDQGYDENERSFVQAFGERTLDASVLIIPLLGFLPFDDLRIQGTLDAIQKELGDGVLIHRYRSSDRVPDSEGAHLVSSFLFASCLALAGRVDEASDRLAELCTYATPFGTFAEQVSPITGEPIGNLPSASSHLALINASLYVGLARARHSKTALKQAAAPEPLQEPTAGFAAGLMGLRALLKPSSKGSEKKSAR